MGGMGLGKGIRGWCVWGGGVSGDRPGGREGGVADGDRGRKLHWGREQSAPSALAII